MHLPMLIFNGRSRLYLDFGVDKSVLIRLIRLIRVLLTIKLNTDDTDWTGLH